MRRINTDGLVYYQASDWDKIKHGIFTRMGGASQAPWLSLNVGGTVGDDLEAVRENHARMYRALDVDQLRICTTWQVHGADVVHAHGPVQGRRWLAQADGIVTNQPDTPLVMRYADCTPLLFYDPGKQVIGIAHAGWRGTVQGIGANMVSAMQMAYQCVPQDIQVFIGPSISQNCFQVGEEVVDALSGYLGESDHLVRRDPADGSAYVDLWQANVDDLSRMGVNQIEVAGLCTYQRTDEFFSHRAERGKTGRFGAVISL